MVQAQGRDETSATMADEAYLKVCSNCGKRLTARPILYKGYAFCSVECRNKFLTKHQSAKRET